MKQVCMVAIACILISCSLFSMDEEKTSLLKAKEKQKKQEQTVQPKQEVSLSPHVRAWLCRQVMVSCTNEITEQVLSRDNKKLPIPITQDGWVAEIRKEKIYLQNKYLKETITLSGHESFLTAIAFSPNQGLLVSGSHDNTIRMWEINPLQFIKKLESLSLGVKDLQFALDGNMLQSKCWNRCIKTWDLTEFNMARDSLSHISPQEKSFLVELYHVNKSNPKVPLHELLQHVDPHGEKLEGLGSNTQKLLQNICSQKQK